MRPGTYSELVRGTNICFPAKLGQSTRLPTIFSPHIRWTELRTLRARRHAILDGLYALAELGLGAA